MKNFFWKDKSGRGFTNNFDEKEIIHLADHEAGLKDEVSWNGESLMDWQENAEVGDKWENDTNEITRTA